MYDDRISRWRSKTQEMEMNGEGKSPSDNALLTEQETQQGWQTSAEAVAMHSVVARLCLSMSLSFVYFQRRQSCTLLDISEQHMIVWELWMQFCLTLPVQGTRP